MEGVVCFKCGGGSLRGTCGVMQAAAVVLRNALLT